MKFAFACSMMTFLAAQLPFAAPANAELRDDGKAIIYKMEDRREAEAFYAKLNLPEQWVSGSDRVKRLAKAYMDPTGTFGFLCALQGAEQSTCLFRINKVSGGEAVKIQHDEQLSRAITVDPATMEKMYEFLSVPEMAHGDYVIKVLTSENMDVSLSCVKGIQTTDSNMCQLQFLK